MKTTEYTMQPLFDKFIRDSLKGRRLKPDGTLMKKTSVENYMYVMKLLVAYEKETQTTIRIKAFSGNNTRLFMQEKNTGNDFTWNSVNTCIMKRIVMTIM